MGAELTITLIQEMVWRWYENDIADARAERDRFERSMGRSLGKEEANRIAQLVQVAVDPTISSPLPYLGAVQNRAFLELLTLELALREIKSRADGVAKFHDPYTVDAILPTLGLSWWVDICPAIPGVGRVLDCGQLAECN